MIILKVFLAVLFVSNIRKDSLVESAILTPPVSMPYFPRESSCDLEIIDLGINLSATSAAKSLAAYHL